MKILFGGDVHFGASSVVLDPSLKDVISAHRHFCVNLESPITERPFEAAKEVTLRNSPAMAGNNLLSLGVTAAIIANNHVLDCGSGGLRDTQASLALIQIPFVGAGDSRSKAQAPLIVSGPKEKIGLIACCESSIGGLPARDSHPGINILDLDVIVPAIAELRPQVDRVVVSVHWGLTNYRYPRPTQIGLAKELLGAGADYIIGHHPHVMQGMSQLPEGRVFFSLGNLVFARYFKGNRPVRISSENTSGTLVSIELGPDRDHDRIDLYFTRFDQKLGTLSLLHEKQASKRRAVVERLSRPLRREGYARFYKWIVIRRMVRRLGFWLNPLSWRGFGRGQLAGLRHALRAMRTGQ